MSLKSLDCWVVCPNSPSLLPPISHLSLTPQQEPATNVQQPAIRVKQMHSNLSVLYCPVAFVAFSYILKPRAWIMATIDVRFVSKSSNRPKECETWNTKHQNTNTKICKANSVRPLWFVHLLSGKRPGTPYENIGASRRAPGQLPDKSLQQCGRKMSFPQWKTQFFICTWCAIMRIYAHLWAIMSNYASLCA